MTRRMMLFESLEQRTVMAADVIISEFMASNTRSLTSSNGVATYDWIEITNKGDMTQDLSNWGLTDLATNLSKWKFPAGTSIAPGEYKIIFASNLGATPTPASELHANTFALSKGGEYLGLSRWDGGTSYTVVSEYAPTFPAQNDDVSYGRITTTAGVQSGSRFFTLPTPGEANLAPPGIASVTNTTPIDDNSDIRVSAAITIGTDPIDANGVKLRYRVMFGSEVELVMRDDGLNGDGTAGDSVYTATIPAAASAPGEMVRWFVTASSTGTNVRAPIFNDPLYSSQYFGTVIPETAVGTLPVFQFFIQNPTWFKDANGNVYQDKPSTWGAMFYNGKFYDNIQFRVRGQNSVYDSLPNQKFKIDFNDDNKFDFGDGRPVTGSINLDNVYQDPSYVRLTLASEVFQKSGALGNIMLPVEARMNGNFYSLGIYSERYNGAYLKRQNLDGEGAVYESEGLSTRVNGITYYSQSAGNLATTAGFEKDNREWETSTADLQALVDGISPNKTTTERDRYIFDNINLPQLLNVLSVYAIVKHFDRDMHNFYLYRDSDGSGEWSMLAYDLDFVFNRMKEPIYTNYFSGSPFEGSSQDPSWDPGHWNRLVDAFADSPVLSKMLLVRMRSLMDQFLSLSAATSYINQRAYVINSQVFAVANVDKATWGNKSGGSWGGPFSLAQGLQQMIDGVASIRSYLYSFPGLPPANNPNAVINFGALDANPLSGNQDQEFVELKNPNAFSVDLSDWQITGGINYTISKGVVLLPGQSVYIVKDTKAFRARETGPTGNKSLFVQGGYSGRLSTDGETLELRNAAGNIISTWTFGAVPVISSATAPTIIRGESMISTVTANDLDTPAGSLVYSATAQPLNYYLKTSYQIQAAPNTPFTATNARGMQEKYLSTPQGILYYITPSGDLYHYDGDAYTNQLRAFSSEFIANVGTEVYANPALLYNAQPFDPPATIQILGNQVTVTPPTAFIGKMATVVKVSDGTQTSSKLLISQVNDNAAPVIGPIAIQTTKLNTPVSVALSVSDLDTATSALSFSGTAMSLLAGLDAQYNFRYLPTEAGITLFNYRGGQEKYFRDATNAGYYILPTGILYKYVGPGLNGTVFADVGTAVYDNPTLLSEAPQTPQGTVTFAFDGGTSTWSATVTPNTNFFGTLFVTITASDGTKSTTKRFNLVVS